MKNVLFFILIVGYDAVSTKRDVPRFLMDTYECWTSHDTDPIPDRTKCLPMDSDYDLHDVNRVKMLKGAASAASDGSYNDTIKISALPPSLSYSFRREEMLSGDITRYGFIHIFKDAISNKVAQNISEQCNGASLYLQLLWKLSPNDHVYTLLSTTILNTSEIVQSMDVKFKGITAQLKQWQESERELEIRLIISGSNLCYHTFTLQDFGFQPHGSANIFLYNFHLNSDNDLLITKLNEFTEEVTNPRKKRSSHDDDRLTNTNRNACNESEGSRCQLYPFNITFADLRDFQQVVSPQSYNAGYCAGSCNGFQFPSKHQYMQNLASGIYPNLPAPALSCCPSQLKDLSVIFSPDPETYVILWWSGMIATSCACN